MPSASSRAVAERGASPFGRRYAALYDAIYGDKDYRAECRHLERLFARFGGRPVRSVLSLGCGTGGHDLILARHGFQVTGVDRSPGMLAAYRAKAAEQALVADVARADLRSARLGRRFDAVISMFAVIGYQVTDRDLARAFATAAAHLRPRGVFVFDVWYGPALLRDPPGDRTKTVRSDGGRIVRRSRSRIDALRQVVDVEFRTERFVGARRLERIDEVHPMRFFFPRELGLALEGAGLGLVAILPFGKSRGRPTDADWTVSVVATAP
jgi:SAM-dependent methyltransferase